MGGDKNTENNDNDEEDYFRAIHDGLFTPTSILDDLVSMQAILKNRIKVEKSLDQLEKLLHAQAKSDGIFDNPEMKSAFSDMTNPKKFKLLSKVLKAWFIDNNFDPKIYKSGDLLDDKEFRTLIRNGFFLKDRGNSDQHGVWAHLIQWFVIVECNKANPIFKNPVESLYKVTGEFDTLWWSLFDNVGAKRKDDCTSPYNLTELIKNNRDRFPTLSIIVEKGYRDLDLTPTGRKKI